MQYVRLLVLPVLGLLDIDAEKRQVRIVDPVREPSLGEDVPELLGPGFVPRQLGATRDRQTEILVGGAVAQTDLGVAPELFGQRRLVGGEEPMAAVAFAFQFVVDSPVVGCQNSRIRTFTNTVSSTDAPRDNTRQPGEQPHTRIPRSRLPPLSSMTERGAVYFFAVVFLRGARRGLLLEPRPFAISPEGSLGSPAFTRSFSAISAISSGA